MQLERILGKGKKGVFYGVENSCNNNLTLEKQIQKAEDFVSICGSKIIKKFIDDKNELLLNNLLVTRKKLLELMQWTVANECDFIICYTEGYLYDDHLGKQKIKKFVAANQIPIILCDKKVLFHPIAILI